MYFVALHSHQTRPEAPTESTRRGNKRNCALLAGML